MFNAKPKFNNYGAKEFEDHMDAVAYLNENSLRAMTFLS